MFGVSFIFCTILHALSQFPPLIIITIDTMEHVSTLAWQQARGSEDQIRQEVEELRSRLQMALDDRESILNESEKVLEEERARWQTKAEEDRLRAIAEAINETKQHSEEEHKNLEASKIVNLERQIREKQLIDSLETFSI